MQTKKRKNRWKTDQRFRRSLCALFLAIGLAATGVSLAYFTSSDRTTNRMESDYTYSLDIVLTEPKWDSKGELDAQKSVPGMEIDKDPYVTNYLPTDVYIRLKLEFIDSEGNVVERNDADLTEFDYYQTNSCQINDENKDKRYSRFLSAVYYFTGNSSDSATHLLTKQDTDIQSSNPYFYYHDGWFYYLDYGNTSESNRSNLKLLAYKERTVEPLFTTVKLPVYKDEYNDLFAKGFQIRVTAQAVDVAKFVDEQDTPTISTSLNMTEIEKVFQTEFPE